MAEDDGKGLLLPVTSAPAVSLRSSYSIPFISLHKVNKMKLAKLSLGARHIFCVWHLYLMQDNPKPCM